MAGSDDRPFAEWTLLERLAAAADGKAYGLSADKLAQAAFDEIERLRRPRRLAYDKARRTITCGGESLGIGIEDTPLA